MRSLIPSTGTRRIALILAILLTASCEDAQEVTAPFSTRIDPTVAGSVVTDTGEPVAGARVSIGPAAVTTGADGRFELTGLTPGPARLRCVAAGFRDVEVDITVPSGTLTRDIPLFPAQEPPPPPEPKPPVVGAVDGVYDLTASITGFDPVWGDLTGYRYTGILTFRHDAGQRLGIGGTFSDLRIESPEGESILVGGSGTGRGVITSFLDFDGRRVIELVTDHFHFTMLPEFPDERPEGPVPLLEGSFSTGGHIWGPFAAERRPGEDA